MKKIILPGSKSITNRDLILASICEGICEIKGYLKSDDTKYMIEALKNLGINILEKNGNLIIDGGINKINGQNQEIYVHQSGTCMRFLTGLSLLNQTGNITLTGEQRLLDRPIGDLFDGIKQMGINLITNNDLAPVTIIPSQVSNSKINMKGTSSSQFFTSLLQVGALIPGGLEINVVGEMVSKAYIDLSIEELRKFGIKILNDDYKKFVINEQNIINPGVLQIEGDASALSYFANYVIYFGEKLEISNIGNNSKQGDYKYLDVLKKYFGLSYVSDGNNTILDGTNLVFDNSNFRKVDFENMPDISMSFMSLAPLLNGVTKIVGLQTLNLKECKRINAMAKELSSLGVNLSYTQESMIINAGFNPPEFVNIETYKDHRIAMVFGIVSLYLQKNYNSNLNIINKTCVAKTYPNFWEDLEKLNK